MCLSLLDYTYHFLGFFFDPRFWMNSGYNYRLTSKLHFDDELGESCKEADSLILYGFGFDLGILTAFTALTLPINFILIIKNYILGGAGDFWTELLFLDLSNELWVSKFLSILLDSRVLWSFTKFRSIVTWCVSKFLFDFEVMFNSVLELPTLFLSWFLDRADSGLKFLVL